MWTFMKIQYYGWSSRFAVCFRRKWIISLESFNISHLHVVLWVSLSSTLSGTLRIVFHSHLVLCASMRLKVRNNFTFCFLHYFSIFFSKFWYFIIISKLIFLANSKFSLTPWMRSKLAEIYEHFYRTIFFMWRQLIY